ncbi:MULTISPECIES: hypothetical protein [Halobacterium]|uniref:hypothetical protein n=1 Tax=Halobacterium TaxID=2239 RepID=UPI00073E1D5C|nr:MULTISPECIES: hypothetical protein [Halobacterium]MCG1003976.1 hypothetical protein [Halobacterium noricense]
MVSRRTLEFLVGVVAAATIAGGLSLSVATPYALAVGLAAGTPSLVRTSARLDRDAYDADHTSTEQIVDGAIAAGATLVVGLAAAYFAVTSGYDGPIAAAGVAALGVLAGQFAFYTRTAAYEG